MPQIEQEVRAGEMKQRKKLLCGIFCNIIYIFLFLFNIPLLDELVMIN